MAAHNIHVENIIEYLENNPYVNNIIINTTLPEDLPRFIQLLDTQRKPNNGTVQIMYLFGEIYMYYTDNSIFMEMFINEPNANTYEKLDVFTRVIDIINNYPRHNRKEVTYQHSLFNISYDNIYNDVIVGVNRIARPNEDIFNNMLRQLLTYRGIRIFVYRSPRFQQYLNGVHYDNIEVRIYPPSIIFKNVIENEFIYLDQMESLQTIIIPNIPEKNGVKTFWDRVLGRPNVIYGGVTIPDGYPNTPLWMFHYTDRSYYRTHKFMYKDVKSKVYEGLIYWPSAEDRDDNIKITAYTIPQMTALQQIRRNDTGHFQVYNVFQNRVVNSQHVNIVHSTSDPIHHLRLRELGYNTRLIGPPDRRYDGNRRASSYALELMGINAEDINKSYHLIRYYNDSDIRRDHGLHLLLSLYDFDINTYVVTHKDVLSDLLEEDIRDNEIPIFYVDEDFSTQFEYILRWYITELYNQMNPDAAKIRAIRIQAEAEAAKAENREYHIPTAMRFRIPIEIIQRMLQFLVHY